MSRVLGGVRAALRGYRYYTLKRRTTKHNTGETMNSHTAYLLLSIDTTTSPPTVRSAGVYSEEQPETMVSKYTWAEIGRATGVSYEDAKARVLALSAHHAWLQALLGRAL